MVDVADDARFAGRAIGATRIGVGLTGGRLNVLISHVAAFRRYGCSTNGEDAGEGESTTTPEEPCPTPQPESSPPASPSP